jgi:hypothetical protein
MSVILFFTLCIMRSASTSGWLLTVQTDRPCYTLGDIVYVSGTLTYNAYPVQSVQITVTVKMPSGALYYTGTATTDQDGNYNTSCGALGGLNAILGQYNVTATCPYMTTWTTFQVIPILPPMNLTVIGLNNTRVVLNSTDIASLPSVRGLGGAGRLDNYTGVSVAALCNLVGGINNDSVVKITASDNYSQTFTSEQVVNGNLTTSSHSQPLTLIIAYYKNDANLTTQGPLMSAIIGSEGVPTNAHYWVWYATEIQVLNAGAVPEFPQSSLTLLLMIAAFAAILFSHKFPAKHQGQKS